ncbi:AI-2E family transporter, partial [uncultured Negativibacillus sp.]|uniref:AI-2E family transporter n=1 Tax=uncultured Negativibacillus sp. TaxID=1980696 RepID=UPI0025D8692C
MKFQINKKYLSIAVYAFLVIAASICFFYLINEHTTVGRVLGGVVNLLIPFIYGAALAYILNPVLNWLEQKVFPKLFGNSMTPRGRRRLGVLITLLFAVAVVAIFLAILIPQIVESIDSLATSIYEFLPKAQLILGDLVEEYGSNEVLVMVMSAFGIDISDPSIALQRLAARSYTFLTQVLPNLFGGVLRFTSGLLNVIVGII